MGGERRKEEQELGAEAILPDVAFEPERHVSPYELFRLLREGRPPRLWALPDTGPVTLEGALPYPAAGPEAPDLAPGEHAVLVDRDGKAALAEIRRLHATHPDLVGRVLALYGGLALYDFCLDPRVVGDHRYLRATG